MTKKSPQRASRPQIIQINDILKDVLILPSVGGRVDYKEGHSDHSVAERVQCALSSVQQVRNEMYGQLRTSTGSMRAEVDLLKQQLDELRVKYHRLTQVLALNKVADVRHLCLADMDPPKATIQAVIK
jgi:hypothetical protein